MSWALSSQGHFEDETEYLSSEQPATSRQTQTHSVYYNTGFRINGVKIQYPFKNVFINSW